ncbi:MAG: hypothetical protein KGL74_09445 [Elusimicrobia bacterium]|nr:hypothetical protein [Elusimicrobiota bacterium]
MKSSGAGGETAYAAHTGISKLKVGRFIDRKDPPKKVKGKTKPVRIFALLGTPETAASEPFRAFERTHQALLAAYRGQKWDEVFTATSK